MGSQGSYFLQADIEDSDQTDRWAHMPFCWFCHDAAQILLIAESSSYLFVRLFDFGFCSSAENIAVFLKRLEIGRKDGHTTQKNRHSSGKYK